MPPARFRCIALAGCALLGACNDTRDLAPASPDTPWQFESSKEATAAPAPAAVGARRFAVPENTAVHLPSAADVDPSHVYLFGRADRHRPKPQSGDPRRLGTGAAGRHQCRHCALCVSSCADRERAWRLSARRCSDPQQPCSARVHHLHVEEVYPRNSRLTTCCSISVAALPRLKRRRQFPIAGNAGFTATHQQVIFNVARAYFMLDGATAAVRAARQALADAKVVQRSAEALFGRGLDTVVNVQLGRRETAQAQFDLAQASAAQHDAMYTFLAAMDLPPTTKLQMADASARPLPSRTAAHRRRCARRRHCNAARSAGRRGEAARDRCRNHGGTFRPVPKIGAGRKLAREYRPASVDAPSSGVSSRRGTVAELKWPLYQGGCFRTVSLAQSQREEAADELEEHTDQALREVALA